MKSFEGSFRNLNFSPSTSILLNFFFPFTDITCFFSSLKLQYCRTIVLLNKLFFLKKPLFQKRRWSCDFPPRKTPVAQKPPKAPSDSPPRKKVFSTPPPRRVVLRLLSPPPESVRAYADVTTKISRMDRLPTGLKNR